jgi:hypothetical protein
MTVADLNFSLGVSGEREVERSLETIEDGLEDAQDAAERLGDADPDVDVDADVAAEQQKLQAALNTVRALNSKDANIDVDADGVQSTIAEGVAAAERLDDLEADIELDVDSDQLSRAASNLPSSSGAGSSSGSRTRLPGELDEVAEVGRAFARLPARIKALSGALVASAAALGAAGGLAGAATALATRFGDLELRQDLQKLKQRFRALGATFVDAFEPVIRNTVIPAGVALAEKLEAVLPELKDFTQDNLPQLAGAVTGLVEAILNTVKAFGVVSQGLGVLASAIQGIGQLPGLDDFIGDEDPLAGVEREFVDILQGFGFGGEQVGSFQVPETEITTIVRRIRSGEMSIGPDGGAGARTGGGAKARGGRIPAPEGLRKIQRQIDVAREKFQRLESFTKRDLLEALKKLRTKGLESLLMLERKTGMSLDRTEEYEKAVERLGKKLRDLPQRLSIGEAQDLFEETAPAAEASAVPTAAEVGASASGPGVGPVASNLPDQISGIPNAQRKVNILKQRLQEASTLGKRATGILRRGFLRVGDAIGSSLVSSIAQGKSAIQSLGSVFKSAIQSILSQLTSLVVKLAVITPLLGALGLTSGGAAIPAVGALGGAVPVPALASGGVVEQSGLALIHKGETVMPAKTSSLSNGTVQSSAPATLAQGQITIPVEVVDRAGNRGSQNRSRVGR